MSDYTHRHKTFEAVDLAWAAMGLWWERMQFDQVQQAHRVLGVTNVSVWNWRSGTLRQDSKALLRMIRLCFWQLDGRRANCFASIDWDAMEVEYASGHDHEHLLPDPFYVSRPRRNSPGRKFAYGSRSDTAAIVRDLMDRGVESRRHLIELLAIPSKTGAHSVLKRWILGERRMGPQYLLRILILLMWSADPYRFAALSDLWAVDWKAREVEYTKDFMRRWREDHGIWESPPNPFFRLMEYAKPPPSRQSNGEYWPPAAPVRDYNIQDYLNGANGAVSTPVEATA